MVPCDRDGPAVFVMFNVVLSQQNESREPLTAPDTWLRRGTHLREQVQGSVAHGTGGVTHPTRTSSPLAPAWGATR
jgi:hypothetical protein